MVCHEHVGPAREWTTEERDFAGSVADLLALKMKAAELSEPGPPCAPTTPSWPTDRPTPWASWPPGWPTTSATC